MIRFKKREKKRDRKKYKEKEEEVEKKGLENEKTMMNGFWVAFCFHQHTALFTTTNRAADTQELEKEQIWKEN